MPNLPRAVLALATATLPLTAALAPSTYAAGLPPAGSPSVPAAPTPRADHCVATVGTGESACFASAGEVAAWKAAHRGWRVLVLFFDGSSYRGAKTELGGYRNCTLTKSDVDYANPALPYGWNDRVSSFITMNGCDLMGYRHTFFGGAHFVRYTDRAATLGSWNNDISSFRLS
jgi:hypothetical protein